MISNIIDSIGLYNLDYYTTKNLIKLNSSNIPKNIDYVEELFSFCVSSTVKDHCLCINQNASFSGYLDLKGSLEVSFNHVKLRSLNSGHIYLSGSENQGNILTLSGGNEIENIQFIYSEQYLVNNESLTRSLISVKQTTTFFSGCTFFAMLPSSITQNTFNSPDMSSFFDIDYLYYSTNPIFLTFKNCIFKIQGNPGSFYPFSMFRIRTGSFVYLSFENCHFELIGNPNSNFFYFDDQSVFFRESCNLYLKNCTFTNNISNSNHWAINSKNYDLKYFKVKGDNIKVLNVNNIDDASSLKIHQNVNLSCVSITNTSYTNIDFFDTRGSYSLKDDFIAGTTEPGEIGELGWSTSGTGTISYASIHSSRPGVIRIQATAINTQFSLHFHNSNTQLIRVNFVKNLKYLVSISNFNGVNLLGLMLNMNNINPDGIYIRITGSLVEGVVKQGVITNTVNLGLINFQQWYQYSIVINENDVYYHIIQESTNLHYQGTLPISNSLKSSMTQFGVLTWYSSSSVSVDIDYIGISFANINRVF